MFTVISPMCWEALTPRSGVKPSSSTTTSSNEYFLLLLGFVTFIRQEPMAWSFEEFHIFRLMGPWLIFAARTKHLGIVFTDAPQSTWNLTDWLFINIFAYMPEEVLPSREFILVTVLILSTSNDDSDESVSSALFIFLTFLGHLAEKWLPLLQILHYMSYLQRDTWISPTRVSGHRINILLLGRVVFVSSVVCFFFPTYW